MEERIKIFYFPRNLRFSGDQCQDCSNKFHMWYETHTEIIPGSTPCRGCTESFMQYSCYCPVEEYVYKFYMCIKCVEKERCRNCEKIFVPERCNKYPSELSKYKKTYSNKVCLKCRICHDCSKPNRPCRECFQTCKICGYLWKSSEYLKGIRSRDLSKTICEKCLKKCDSCKIPQKDFDDIIVPEKITEEELDDNFSSLEKLCQRCLIKKYDKWSNDDQEYCIQTEKERAIKNKYGLDSGYSLFQEWKLFKQKKTCKYCKIKYWLPVDEGVSWQSSTIEDLSDCCEVCYRRKYEELKSIKLSQDPSDENNIYEFDLHNLKWNLYAIYFNCEKCNSRMRVPNTYLSKYSKICSNCDPSDYCHKYLWKHYDWKLDKVRIFDSNRHKWINPTDVYNQSYYCKCDKCIK
jgi:hypothetical protein